MRVYISGPVTGKENRNERLFEETARMLEKVGFETIVPTRIVPKTLDWNSAMVICMHALQHADIVVMLDGWEHSKGAVIEHSYAVFSGKPVFYLPAPDLAKENARLSEENNLLRSRIKLLKKCEETVSEGSNA